MISFTKMHGLGNDFVVLDARAGGFSLDPADARAMADRRRGIGCDQLILIEPPRMADAAAYLRILNADGSESVACGNGTRCVAATLMEEIGTRTISLETAAGLLDITAAEKGQITVNMGRARLDWHEIPLVAACDTLHVGIDVGELHDAVAVNIGNPHCVFFVKDADAVDLARIGPEVEHAAIFPERTNVEIVEIRDEGHIRMRVWERGAGITLACGSGACATVVAAHRRNLTDRKAEVILDGGSLSIEWLETGDVLMTGPVAVSFTGIWNGAIVG
jgi:diaminopimelate epimerase